MPGGRPTLLTPELQRKLLSVIRKGNYRQTACHAVGISPQTIIDWEHRGARGEEPYAQFSEALKRAEAYGERKLLAEIRKGSEAWQARAWILERKYPAKWSGRVRSTVHDELQATMAKLREKLDAATWLKVMRVLSEDPSESGAPEEQPPAEQRAAEH